MMNNQCALAEKYTNNEKKSPLDEETFLDNNVKLQLIHKHSVATIMPRKD